MKQKLTIVLALLSMFSVWSGCKDDVVDKYGKYHYVNLESIPHFPTLVIPDNNPMILERIALGRQLYYDSELSKGGPLQGFACASCHHQSNSFSSNLAKAIIPHVNLGWSKYFLWNGALENGLEDAMVFEVRDFFQVDLSNVRQNESYRIMFKEAFHTEDINYQNMAMALAQFLRTMQSGNSRFDQYLLGKIQLSEAEMRGYAIFNSERGDCFHCHSIPLFTDNQFHNIGLETKFANNLGRYEVTHLTKDVGSYKTPTLRNIILTGPYMHDDRFTTLDEVIEHYNSGVKSSPVLDPIMSKVGKETGLHLSVQEKSDLKAFLLALTDSTFLSNKALGDPN